MTFTAYAETSKRESDVAAIHLLTFDHPDLVSPVRISDDPTTRLTTQPLAYGTVSNGDTYNFLPIRVELPDETERGAPTARLAVDNVDRGLTAIIRSITSPATVTIDVVLSDDLDTSIRAVAPMQVRVASITAEQITLEFMGDILANEGFPGRTFNAGDFAALFT